MNGALVQAADTHPTAQGWLIRHAATSGPRRIAVRRHPQNWAGDLTPSHSVEKAIQSPMSFLLDYYFRIRGREAVLHFVEAHPELNTLLLEAASALDRYFGPGQRATLEIILDPETENAPELVAHVKTSLSVPEALDRLDQFDQEWFLDRVRSVKGLFNVNLVFV